MRDRSPAAERWSTAGVIEHLALVETRLAALLSERIAAARAEGVGRELDMSPVLPSLRLSHLLDRTTRISAAAIVQPTGLAAEAAWARSNRRAWGSGTCCAQATASRSARCSCPVRDLVRCRCIIFSRSLVRTRRDTPSRFREIADTFAAGQDTHHEHEHTPGEPESRDDRR